MNLSHYLSLLLTIWRRNALKNTRKFSKHDSVVDWKVDKFVSEFTRELILPILWALIVWIKWKLDLAKQKPVVSEYLLMRRNEFSEFSNNSPTEFNKEGTGDGGGVRVSDKLSPRVFSTCFEEYMMSKSSNSSGVLFKDNWWKDGKSWK